MCSSEEILFSDEESIDRERVITTEQELIEGLFCPICFCLLWKPRSCSSCRNLFCQKCIQIWLKKNFHTCPLCRAVYEDQPVSSSILSHCSIRCRNTSFGCPEILSYDWLEQHESIECRFRTKTCRICEQLILLKDIDQHKSRCQPMVIQCSVCQQSVKIDLFERHREECGQRYSNLLHRNLLPGTEMILPTVLPVGFVGGELFHHTRRRNCFIRFYTMLKLILSNRTWMHLIFLNCFVWGCTNLIESLTIAYRQFQSYIRSSSTYRTLMIIFIFGLLFNYILLFIVQSFNDRSIIFFIIISLIIWSCISSQIQLNQFQLNFTFQEFLLFSLLIFFALQIPLLILRFYFHHILLSF